MAKIAGSGSEFISQRYGSADLVLEPDPHQMLWICNTGWDSGSKLGGCSLADEQRKSQLSYDTKSSQVSKCGLYYIPKNTLDSWFKIKHMFYFFCFHHSDLKSRATSVLYPISALWPPL